MKIDCDACSQDHGSLKTIVSFANRKGRFAVILLLALSFFAERCTSAQETGEQFSIRVIQKLESEGKHQTAFDQLSKEIVEQPSEAILHYWRGRQAFCLGNIEQAVEDFDHYFEQAPDSRTRQWERGIALYYAGRFTDGAKQFDAYQAYDNADVENSIWHYLCLARAESPEVAKRSLIPVRRDSRVPMMEIYEFYQGKLQSADVLSKATTAAESNGEDARPQFYAHLYIGLYFEAHGDNEKAAQHLKKAREHKISHYMWNVADIHVRRLAEHE